MDKRADELRKECTVKFLLTNYLPDQHSFFLKHQWVDALSSQDHILQTKISKSCGLIALTMVEERLTEQHLLPSR